MTYNKWRELASRNIEKWGMQDKETLALAMMEELGELTQAILQFNNLPLDCDEATLILKYNRIKAELDDLAPLMYQMEAVL